MSFITGLILVDAPASALNNTGSIPDELYGNKVAVKAIRSGGKVYPYVSAQAYRYWHRTTLEKVHTNWKAAPTYREEKVAYTDANPIEWWDDDLFGYMRAPKTGEVAQKARTEDSEYQKLTPLDVKNNKEQGITRVSPYRVSTLVAVASTNLVEDWESMSRMEGDSVPYSSQFYRATLKGLLSLDLHAAGTFSYRDKTGYRNLDEVRKRLAEEQGLQHLEDEKSYRLPTEARVQRISALLNGLAHLEGGAKQSLHYTDVSPALVVLAVTKGGNHIFGHIIGANRQEEPVLKIGALEEALTVFKDDILSDIYVGWVKGYLDDQRADFEKELNGETGLATFKSRIKVSHPRDAFKGFVDDLQKSKNANWLD